MGGLFGGGGQKAYVSKNAPGYENTAQDYIYNRLGVKRATNNGGTGGTTSSTGYVPGGRWASQDEYNRFGGGTSAINPSKTPTTTFDSSQVGQPINFQSGVGKDPNTYFGQDYSGINKAISGFGNIDKLTQTYDPSTFTFANEKLEGLPELFQKLAYDQGSKVARNEAKGNLETIKEAVGVRRPGLLMQAEQGNQRNLMSTLGDLNSRLKQQAMQDKENMALQDKNFLMQQQMGQAGENYKGYSSRADLEKNNAQLGMTGLQNLYNAAAGKIGMQQGQLGNERQYADQALQYLLNLFASSIGSQNQAAANSTAQRGQTLGFLGDAAKGVAGMFI